MFGRFDIEGDDETQLNFTPPEHTQIPSTLVPSPPLQEEPQKRKHKLILCILLDVWELQIVESTICLFIYSAFVESFDSAFLSHRINGDICGMQFLFIKKSIGIYLFTFKLMQQCILYP